jgi:hypothetical protein
MRRREAVGIVAVLAAIAAYAVYREVRLPRLRAENAHVAVRLGMTCREAVNALAPFEDEWSRAENSERCQALGRNLRTFEPTFTSRLTVTYTFTVTMDEEGRVADIAPLAIW